MKAVIQRVKKASVKIENRIHASISKGLVVFLGVGKGDNESDVEYLVRKIINLRIFENELGKFDFSLKDIDGEMLVVSQFTLYADCKKGNRPSFENAETPDNAKMLYEKFVEKIRENGIKVVTGVFGAKMEIELINDGPVTIILESR